VDTIDLKQIRCFIAAYEEGSFSRAAEREHCTQPGLSLHMRRLETVLSQKLFHRSARGVKPTVAARQFYAACSEVMDAVTSAKQRMMDLSGNIAGSIRIGLPPTLFRGALSWMLPNYMQTHPYVRVGLFEGIVGGTFAQRLMGGEIDAAVVSAVPDHVGLKSSHFFTDRLVLVTSAAAAPDAKRRGRRAARTKHVRAADLTRFKLVLPSKLHTLRQIVDRVARPGEAGSGQLVEIDGVLGKLDLVRHTDWASVLPSIAVADEVRQRTLRAAPICEPELWLEYFVIQPAHAVLSTACRDFLRQLRETLERNRPLPAPQALRRDSASSARQA
jgi:LysR family transcriptional regulator, nitrogen assimilation regulatory protein